MKKVFLLIWVSIVLGGSWVFAQSPENQFFEANRLYAEGKYEDAVHLYEKMVQEGTRSDAIYYNLGNAYFKLGRTGKSILNYERARRIAPQDEDLLANLSFAMSLLEQAQPKEDYLWYEWFMVRLRELFSANGWALFLLIVYQCFFIGVLFALFVPQRRKATFPILWTFGLLIVFTLLFTSSKIFVDTQQREGVIVARIADVRYSPSSEGAIAFQLKEGLKAYVDQCTDEWCHIRLTKDKSGWVKRPSIEEI